MKVEKYNGKLDFKISVDEIKKALKTLKSKKAMGIDQVNNEMLKAAMPLIIKALQCIFNAILEKQYYPSGWKKGIIVNIFKSGDKMDTNNYRGLTVNSCIGKLFNCILNNRLTDLVDKEKVIPDCQIGFKKGARTSDHIFILNTLFRKYVKDNNKLFLCFVDFKKAYDSVWREALMLKLLRKGIGGNFWGVISNMLLDNESYIKSDGFLSESFSCETGVRQGDVLSPNLFNLFLNDLPQIFDECLDSPKLESHLIHCLLYADDLVLFSLSENGLQTKINKLKEYCETWSLDINTKKTQVMVMSSSSSEMPKSVMKFGESCINWTNCYKYLGIQINNNGSTTAMTENLSSRAWKAVFKMKSAFKDIDVSPKLQIKMFRTLIRPILCYCCEIWGPFIYNSNNQSNISDLSFFWKKIEKLPVEMFNIKYLKGLLGVHSKALNAAVMGETGVYPMFEYIIQSALRYQSHLDEVLIDRPFLAAAVNEDKMLPKTKSWHKRTQSLLDMFGFNSSKKDNCVINNKLKPFLRLSYENFWKSELGDLSLESGKLSLYRKIKFNFGFESYLTHLQKFKYRRSVTSLRISAHKLEVEIGRYTNKTNTFVARDRRYCMICLEDDIHVLGDEIHAMFICPVFQVQRDKLLKYFVEKYPYFKLLNNIEKFIFILSSENHDIHIASKFIHDILMYKRPRFNLNSKNV